jgi:hypothetical protein
MPWRGPEYPGEFPTLGYKVAQWIQSYCVIPDREDAGRPFVLTPEQLKILVLHYRIRPDAEFDHKAGRWRNFWVYDRGTQVRRPQKWGKAPLSSAVACVEAAPDSEVLFDGWDADGEPVGRPWPTPHIQVTACSEDQTDNIWRALLPMIQLGPLADVFDHGLTRINLPTGGLIEPVTAAAISRLGQRVTCALQDQTESWVQSNGGIKLADNQRRGLAGTGGRFFETPNAHDPVEDSVAQRTSEGKAPGVYLDLAEPPAGSVRNKRERRKVLEEVYGDSTIENGGWIDLNRIDSEIEALLEHDAAQAERWFLNRTLASEGSAFDIDVDGALLDDALAVIACEIKTGFMWPLGIWERPADAGPDYEHPKSEVDDVVVDAFETYSVWRMECDDQWIEDLIERWQNRYGEKRVIVARTNRWRQIAWAVRNFEQAVNGKDGELTHSGNEKLTRHIANARKRMLNVLDDRERPMHTLAKPAQHSPLKIDGAMGGVIAWDVRGKAITARVVQMHETSELPPEPQPQRWEPGTALPAAALTVPVESGPMGSLS